MSEVLFVGTSDAFGAGGRRQSAILVRSDEGTVLLDCGATTVSGLAALGVERHELDAVLLSHFHGDHFAGVPQLLLASLYADRRTRSMVIAGPAGVEERVRAAARHLGFGLEERAWSFPVEFRELHAGKLERVGPVEASSFETHHQREVSPHGLSVRTGGRRVVFSGDTGWFDALPEHVAGADLFVCECTYLEAGILEYHLSLEEISERAGEFDCGQLVLTHLGAGMAERRGGCEIATADDGLRIQL